MSCKPCSAAQLSTAETAWRFALGMVPSSLKGDRMLQFDFQPWGPGPRNMPGYIKPQSLKAYFPKNFELPVLPSHRFWQEVASLRSLSKSRRALLRS